MALASNGSDRICALINCDCNRYTLLVHYGILVWSESEPVPPSKKIPKGTIRKSSLDIENRWVDGSFELGVAAGCLDLGNAFDMARSDENASNRLFKKGWSEIMLDLAICDRTARWASAKAVRFLSGFRRLGRFARSRNAFQQVLHQVAEFLKPR